MQLAGERIDDEDGHSIQDLRNSEHCFEGKRKCCGYSCDQKQTLSRKVCNGICERDDTILLLRKEIESALNSLKEVQTEMAKLHGEKQEMLMSKKQNEEVMKCFANELHTLQATVDNFEKQSELKIEAINKKLGLFESVVHEAGSDWCRAKEVTCTPLFKLYSCSPSPSDF